MDKRILQRLTCHLNRYQQTRLINERKKESSLNFTGFSKHIAIAIQNLQAWVLVRQN